MSTAAAAVVVDDANVPNNKERYSSVQKKKTFGNYKVEHNDHLSSIKTY